MPENIIPGFTERWDQIIFGINDVLEEWESVKAGEYTWQQIARGREIIAELTGAK